MGALLLWVVGVVLQKPCTGIPGALRSEFVEFAAVAAAVVADTCFGRAHGSGRRQAEW